MILYIEECVLYLIFISIYGFFKKVLYIMVRIIYSIKVNLNKY